MSYKIIKYPDGTSYAESGACDKFTYRINSYEDLWHLGQIIEALNHNLITPEVTIPNLIDAQADRRFGQHQSSGLKLVCNFLNQFQARYFVFHPHNPEVVEAGLKNVVIRGNTWFIEQVLKKISKESHIYSAKQKLNASLILMSSDAGGFKPLMKLCDGIGWEGETYSASKAREYAGGKSKLTQLIDKQDFGGKDILIVHDICVYGGTFKGLAKMLRERNCGKLYLAVSHMTVQNLGKDSVTNYFDKVFTTNSKFDTYWNGEMPSGALILPENLEIIKMF